MTQALAYIRCLNAIKLGDSVQIDRTSGIFPVVAFEPNPKSKGIKRILIGSKYDMPPFWGASISGNMSQIASAGDYPYRLWIHGPDVKVFKIIKGKQ